jgi:hypothetical protein
VKKEEVIRIKELIKDKVYCEDCRFSWGNHQGISMCNNDDFKYLSKDAGDSFRKPSSYMACRECSVNNAKNDCTGFKTKSKIKAFLKFINTITGGSGRL